MGAFGNTQSSIWNPFRTYKVTNSEVTGANASGNALLNEATRATSHDLSFLSHMMQIAPLDEFTIELGHVTQGV